MDITRKLSGNVTGFQDKSQELSRLFADVELLDFGEMCMHIQVRGSYRLKFKKLQVLF